MRILQYQVPTKGDFSIAVSIYSCARDSMDGLAEPPIHRTLIEVDTLLEERSTWLTSKKYEVLD